MLTDKQLIDRAVLFYSILPKGGFSDVTYKELGTSARFGVEWSKLSRPLKVTLLTLVKVYHEGLSALEVEEALAAIDKSEAETPSPADVAPTPLPAVEKPPEAPAAPETKEGEGAA